MPSSISNLPSFMTLMLLILTALAAPTVSIPNDWKHWRAQDTSKSLSEAYATSNRSFDVAVNENFCDTNSVKLEPPHPDTKDYGRVISSVLASMSLFGGGAVRLSSGVYPVLSPIVMPSRTCLLGAGMAKTTLDVGDTFDNYADGVGVLRATAVERVTLKDFTVFGVRGKGRRMRMAAPHGVHFKLVNYAWLENVRSTNNPDTGFNVVGSGWRWSYHLAMEGCVSENNGGDGVNVEQMYYAALVNCRSVKSGRHGLRVSSAARNVLLRGNTVIDTPLCGLIAELGGRVAQLGRLPPRSIHIESTTVTNAAFAGICLADVTSEIQLTASRIKNRRDDTAACFDVRRSAIANADWKCDVVSGVEFSPPGRRPWALPIPQGPGQGCDKGILFRDVCCPAACGLCGGRGCGTRLPDAKCCYTEVKAMNRNCRFFKPPCVVRL